MRHHRHRPVADQPRRGCVAPVADDRCLFGGNSPIGIPPLQDALRLKVNWYSNTRETSGQFGALFNAILAVHAGLCRHVLVFRTMYQATARKRGLVNASYQPGQRTYSHMGWYAPYHAYVASTQQALYFARYVHATPVRL